MFDQIDFYLNSCNVILVLNLLSYLLIKFLKPYKYVSCMITDTW